MSMNSVMGLEEETMKESFLHLLDGRVKLIVLVLITVYAVYTPQILVLVLMEFYLLLLIFLSHISFKTVMKRVLLLLPFGGLIVLLQPFIQQGIVIYSLPLGINITYQGLIFGTLLLFRLIVSLTAIVLLSSISPMQEVVQSFRKLGMPKEFAMIFSLMIRFLFLFYDELQRIRNAQKTRNFHIFNKKTAYMWKMKQLGYTVMMMFLKAYEQGEKVYFSMLSRGYSDKSNLYDDNKKLKVNDYTFIAITIAFIACLEITHYFSVI